MDIDAYGRHITNLLAFKAKIEQMLEGALPGHEGPTPAAQVADLTEKFDDLRKDVTELGEAITGLQQFRDSVGGAIAALEDAKPTLQWLVDNKAGLEVLLSLGDTVAADPVPEAQADQTGSNSPAEGASEAPAPEPATIEQPAAPSEAPASEATEQPAEQTPSPAAP